jgi:hypothetical protein
MEFEVLKSQVRIQLSSEPNQNRSSSRISGNQIGYRAEINPESTATLIDTSLRCPNVASKSFSSSHPVFSTNGQPYLFQSQLARFKQLLGAK